MLVFKTLIITMVETNVNIADNKGGNGQGGGSITADKFSSIDESVKIENNEGKIDFSVEIVTEQKKGLESPLDKRLADHSYANIMILEETFATPEEASAYLCSLDPQYYPVAGQIMQYTDLDGNLHIVRYNGSYKIDRTGANYSWGDIVYDKKNNCYLIFHKYVTGNLRFARCYNSPYWTINSHSASYKYWRFIGSHPNVGSIVMSGNNSNVMALTTDGGKTFNEFQTMRNGYHWSIKKNNNQSYDNSFIDISTTTYSYANNQFSYIDQYIFDNSGNITRKSNRYTIPRTQKIADVDIAIVWDAEYIYVPYSLWVFILFQDSKGKTYLGDLFHDKVIPLNGGKNITYAGGNILVYPNYGDRNASFDSYVISKDLEILETYENCHSLVYTDKGIVEIRHDDIKIDGESVELPVSLGNMKLTSGVWNGANNVMVITGTHEDLDNKGNYGFLIDLDKKRIVNTEKWEEIPVIPDGIEGMISIHGNKVEEQKIGNKMRFESDGSLNVDYSDRYSAYSNYMLTAYGNDFYPVIWSKTSRSNLSVGQLVYSDEKCTNACGQISQIGSLNNPNDVYINGGLFVYLFHDSKIPDTIATTKALIDKFDKFVLDFAVKKDDDGYHPSQGDIQNLIEGLITDGMKIPVLVIYDENWDLIECMIAQNADYTKSYQGLITIYFHSIGATEGVSGMYVLTLNVISTSVQSFEFIPD